MQSYPRKPSTFANILMEVPMETRDGLTKDELGAIMDRFLDGREFCRKVVDDNPVRLKALKCYFALSKCVISQALG